MRGESVMVLLVGGHRLTGQVVALAEQGSSDDLWIDRAMQEITLETSVAPDDTDRRTPWRYRIPAAAIVWVAYPAPPDPEGSRRRPRMEDDVYSHKEEERSQLSDIEADS